jgi:hypothetical protein
VPVSSGLALDGGFLLPSRNDVVVILPKLSTAEGPRWAGSVGNKLRVSLRGQSPLSGRMVPEAMSHRKATLRKMPPLTRFIAKELDLIGLAVKRLQSRLELITSAEIALIAYDVGLVRR